MVVSSTHFSVFLAFHFILLIAPCGRLVRPFPLFLSHSLFVLSILHAASSLILIISHRLFYDSSPYLLVH